MTTDKKTSARAAQRQPVQPPARLDAVTLGDINITIFGFKVTAKQLQISRVNAVNATRCK